MKKVVFILFFLTTFLSADIYYPYRDEASPPIALAPDTSIICLGIKRTGSTLIYNVIRYLFEEKMITQMNGTKIFKSHNLASTIKKMPLKKNIIICHSVRDPMDVLASHKNVNIDVKSVLFNPINLIPTKTKHLFKTLTFRYENFINDQFEYIYQVIEEGFKVTIPENAKREVEKHFSLAAAKKIVSKLTNFSSTDPSTGIHGKHINNSSWEKSFTLKESLAFYKTYSSLRKELGYKDLNIEQMWQKANSHSIDN